MARVPQDVVAVWEIRLSDGLHQIEFEHGTTTGKRVVRINNKEVVRKDVMFKLVGQEHFTIGCGTKCCISVDAVGGFAYEYSITVNGKSLKKFSENQSKILQTWIMSLEGMPTRVVLEKQTLDVWVNGQRVPTTGEFAEEGTRTHFSIGNHSCFIQAISSGKRSKGILHHLFVDENQIPEALE